MMRTKKIGILIVLVLFLSVSPTTVIMADEGSTIYLPVVVSPVSPAVVPATGAETTSDIEDKSQELYIPLVASMTPSTVAPMARLEAAEAGGSSEWTEVCKGILANFDPDSQDPLPFKNVGQCVSIFTLVGLETGNTQIVHACKAAGVDNLGQCIKNGGP